MKQKSLWVFGILNACALLQVQGQNTFPASGNAGIGTTAPISALHVKGSVLSENGPNSLAAARNTGFHNWVDRAYGSELHYLNGKWGLAVFARTDSDIRLGHYGGNENAQGNMNVKMLIQPDGKTGIGTTTPLEMLHVKGSVLAENNALSASNVRNKGFYTWTDRAYGMELHNLGGKWGLAVFARTESDIRIGHYAGADTGQAQLSIKMVVRNDGKVGIGAVDASKAGYKLFVEEGILTEKVKVAIKTSADWSDYVFHKNYPLMSIQQVEQFIQTNGHLPGIPSAAEVVNEGIDLGKMNAKLLEKIEELTLYIIDQQKKLDAVQQRLNQLEQKK